MTNLQEIVDELRFIIQREVIEDRPELWELVRRYDEACHAANGRLRQCEACLRQGLRSEAIHIAEQTPPLLDVIATLDFPERSQLLDVVDMYFHEPPEPLLLEIATSLNEAYALQAPLQKVLDQHRLFALARRPLRDRLGVLRQLADQDPATPHWEDDLLLMERARHDEMDAESRAAVATGNASALQELAEEARNSPWRAEFPAALLKLIKSRSSQATRRLASGRLEGLAGELHAAFSALDVAEARRCRDEWLQLSKQAKLGVDDPLVADVAPVLGWLDDEDRKSAEEEAVATTVAAIELALDRDDVQLSELQRLRLPLERLNRSLPTILERRLQTRMRALEAAQAHRRRAIVAAAGIAALLVVGSIGWTVRSAQHAESSRRLTAALEELISTGNFIEARRLTEANLTQTDPGWLAAQLKLADAENAEKDRVLRWSAEMDAVRGAADEDDAAAPLRQARELARTEEEKVEVGKWELSWRKRANESMANREADYRRRLEAVTAAVQTLDRSTERDLMNDSTEFQKLLDSTATDLSQLKSSQKGVAQELVTQTGLLDARLTAARKLINDARRKSVILDRLTESVLIPLDQPWTANRLESYPSTLKEYAAAYPQDHRAAAFKSAAEECPLPVVYAERELLKRWNRKLKPDDGHNLEARLREVRSFLEEHASCPGRDQLRQYQTWLESVQRRFAEDGDSAEGAQQKLARLFNGKFIRDGHTLSEKAGVTYYLKEETEVKEGLFGFQYLIGFNSETKRITKSSDELTTKRTVPPPQQALAKAVRSEMNQLTLENWVETHRNLAETIMMAAEVDTFLRYLLLFKTLEYAAAGDHFLEQELEPVLKKLDDDEIDRSVAWMDPFNKSANDARSRAQELLDQLPPLEPLFQQAKTKQQAFEDGVFYNRFAVGWLEKSNRGQWSCRTRWEVKGHYHLLVAARERTGNGLRWQPVGRVVDAQFEIDQAVAQSTGEAHVVFAGLVQPPESSSKP